MAVEEAAEVEVVVAGRWRVARCCLEELLLDLVLSLSRLQCPAAMAVAWEVELAWMARVPYQYLKVQRLLLDVAGCQLEAMEVGAEVGQKWVEPFAVLALVVVDLVAYSAPELDLVVVVVLEQAAWAVGLLVQICSRAHQALVAALG